MWISYQPGADNCHLRIAYKLACMHLLSEHLSSIILQPILDIPAWLLSHSCFVGSLEIGQSMYTIYFGTTPVIPTANPGEAAV